MKNILFILCILISLPTIAHKKVEVSINFSTDKIKQYLKPITKISLGLLAEFSHLCLLAAVTNQKNFKDTIAVILNTFINPPHEAHSSEETSKTSKRLFLSLLTLPPIMVNGTVVWHGCQELFQQIKQDITVAKADHKPRRKRTKNIHPFVKIAFGVGSLWSYFTALRWAHGDPDTQKSASVTELASGLYKSLFSWNPEDQRLSNYNRSKIGLYLLLPSVASALLIADGIKEYKANVSKPNPNNELSHGENKKSVPAT